MEKILVLIALFFSSLAPQNRDGKVEALSSQSVVADCAITNISFDNAGFCEDNGTPSPDDDFFTMDVIVEYENAPNSGTMNIDLGEDAFAGGGPTSVDVPDLDLPNGTFTFEQVRFKANGDPSEVRVFFSLQPTCTFVINGGPAEAPCSVQPTCSIDLISFSNIGTCNNNGTGTDTDDFFTMNVTVEFTGAPTTGELRIEPGGDALPGGGVTSVPIVSLVGNSHTFTGVRFKSNGTPTVVEVEFTADQGCVRTQTGPTINSCSAGLVCNISSVTFQNTGTCNNNNNSNPADDFFTADVVVTFVNAPATGDLRFEPGGDALPGGGATSVPVANLIGNTHTFSGVRFKADGTQTVAELEFTADQGCVRTQVGPTVSSCCDVSITNIAAVPGSCNNSGGSITITASGANALSYAVAGPANQSNNTGIFNGLPDGLYSISVTDIVANCTVGSSATLAPGGDSTPPTPVCRSASVALDATGNHTFTASELLDLGASSDNCGTVNFVSASPASVSCAQLGQLVPVTVVVNDGNGNTASCTAQMSVLAGSSLPNGLSSANIGAANGSSTFNICASTNITIAANGFSSSNADVLHLASRQLCGNGQITAKVVGVSGGGWAGLTLRETSAQGSKKVDLKTQLSNHVTRSIRTTTNGPVNHANLFRPQESWLRLVRAGNNFSGFTSADGVNWNFAFSSTIMMANCIRVGLFAESINVNTTTTAIFDQLTITGAPSAMMSTGNGAPDELLSLDFQVYPNPTTGEVSINVGAFANRTLKLELSNAQGAVLKVLELDEWHTDIERLDLSSFSNGVYQIRLSAEGLPELSKRVVLQRK